MASGRDSGPSPAVLAATFACGTLLLHGFRVAQSPDVIVDEAVYFMVSRSLATGTGFAFHPIPGNDPYFWQPPLFFVLQAAWLGVAGHGRDLLEGIYAARTFSVAVGAITAGILVMTVWQLAGRRAAVLAGLLFLVDPFVQRGTRRSMIDPLAELFVLLAVLTLYQYSKRRRRRWLVIAGVVAGLAVLSKEIAFFVFLIPLGLAAINRSRAWLRDGIQIGVIGAAVYALYPLWAVIVGAWPSYLGHKEYQLSRFIGFIQTTGWNRAAQDANVPTYSEALFTNLPLYAASYSIIAAGGLAVLVLLLRRSADETHRFVAVWGLVTYLNFAFIIARGQLNDHFFYLLVVPACALAAIAVDAVVRAAGWPVVAKRAALIAYALILGYSSAMYLRNAALGSDNAYSEVAQYVTRNVPAGTTIMADTELASYVFGAYRVTYIRDAQRIAGRTAYVVLSDKTVWGAFDGVSQALYRWIAQNTKQVYASRGNTYWTVRVLEWIGPSATPSLSQLSDSFDALPVGGTPGGDWFRIR